MNPARSQKRRVLELLYDLRKLSTAIRLQKDIA
jgi:hypothetical protein